MDENDNKSLPGDSIEVNREIISLDDFCTLANKLVDQNLYEEAISVYKTAGKLFPDNIAIKLNMGRVQELQRKSHVEQEKTIQEGVSRTRSKEDTTAQNYLSLATLYYTRRKFMEAIELLELSKFKNENNSKTRYLLGRIYYEQGDLNKALEEFTKARELDPFYEDIYKHLGTILYERQEFERALEAFIDAYILSGGEDVAKNSYYQRQIRMLLDELNIEDRKQYNRYFNEKREFFLNLANSLSQTKEATVESGGEGLDHIFDKIREMERAHKSSLDVAVELKKFEVMQSLTDEELITISRLATERAVAANEVIFREDELTEGIFFIQTGSVRIIKSTPFGEQILAQLKKGEFFGEMDFIDSLRCSADAVANDSTFLLVISKIKLEEIFLARKHIAVQFYWHFWKTLSLRIREANELLKSFFVEANKIERDRTAVAEAGEATTVDFQKKMAVLKEKGLSSKELRLLATFCNEELYKAGQTVFMEGDRGDKFYIILDGKIRISKFIPGVGEERWR